MKYCNLAGMTEQSRNKQWYQNIWHRYSKRLLYIWVYSILLYVQEDVSQYATVAESCWREGENYYTLPQVTVNVDHLSNTTHKSVSVVAVSDELMVYFILLLFFVGPRVHVSVITPVTPEKSAYTGWPHGHVLLVSNLSKRNILWMHDIIGNNNKISKYWQSILPHSSWNCLNYYFLWEYYVLNFQTEFICIFWQLFRWKLQFIWWVGDILWSCSVNKYGISQVSRLSISTYIKGFWTFDLKTCSNSS